MQVQSENPINEMMLNFGQIALLCGLLLLPQIIGLRIIPSLGVTEVAHHMDVFTLMASLVIIHYLAIMTFAGRLISRIDKMVYAKYMIVVGVLFLIIADAYLAYRNQQVYALNNRINIIPRDIVWSDVAFEDLPSEVIYPNFQYAFMFVLYTARAIATTVVAYMLISDNAAPKLRKKSSRAERQKKSVDELKANVHPSVLKKYQNKNDN